jgi:hypothetical protein
MDKKDQQLSGIAHLYDPGIPAVVEILSPAATGFPSAAVLFDAGISFPLVFAGQFTVG